MKISSKYLVLVLVVCFFEIGWLIASPAETYGPKTTGFAILLVFVGSLFGVLLGRADGRSTAAFLSKQTMPPFIKIGDKYEVLSSWNMGNYNYYLIRKISPQIDGNTIAGNPLFIETYGIELPKKFEVWKESISKKPKEAESRLIFHELTTAK